MKSFKVVFTVSSFVGNPVLLQDTKYTQLFRLQVLCSNIDLFYLKKNLSAVNTELVNRQRAVLL